MRIYTTVAYATTRIPLESIEVMCWGVVYRQSRDFGFHSMAYFDKFRLTIYLYPRHCIFPKTTRQACFKFLVRGLRILTSLASIHARCYSHVETDAAGGMWEHTTTPTKFFARAVVHEYIWRGTIGGNPIGRWRLRRGPRFLRMDRPQGRKLR